jgi:deoxyadenosine/deoxycytidine kinase
MLVSIEGNIGSGKSTVLEYLKTITDYNIIFVDEPVSEWISIKDKDGMNALDCFYKDQKENAFCFQVLAYITRLKKLMDKLKNIDNNSHTIIITERSIETDRNVFAKMLYEEGLLTSIEWETYNYWFNTFKDISKVDMILYIKTSPVKCLERINTRNRSEESTINLSYLEKCHSYHENWLKDISNIITLDGHNSIDKIRTDVIEFIKNL